jgi:thiol-disulfide isomerase/thioredoxin
MFKTIILVVMTCLLLACSKPVFHEDNGQILSIASLKGKWIFVNYWAGWCENCQQEVPELNKFYQNHKNHAVVLAVNYDGLKNPQLKQAADRFHITFPVLQENPWKVFHLGMVDVVPTMFVINPKGQVVKKLLGPQTERT